MKKFPNVLTFSGSGRDGLRDTNRRFYAKQNRSLKLKTQPSLRAAGFCTRPGSRLVDFASAKTEVKKTAAPLDGHSGW